MPRSQLETKYLNTKTQTDLKLYKKHKNFRSLLCKRGRRKHYESLDMIKTYFSCGLTQKKNNRIISDGLDLPEEFSTFFEDAVRLLNVKSDEYYLSDRENLSTPVEFAIR